MSFTLPRGVFYTPPLTAKERAEYIARGRSELREFIASVVKKQDSYVWDPLGDSHGVSLFQAYDPKHKADKSMMQYRALAKIDASLEEIAELHCFDTKEGCDQYRQYYAHDILDMVTLYTLLEKSPTHPLEQIYIKWSTFQSPVAVIKHRDFLYLETQDAFILENGRRGWAFCQSSIEIETCPQLTQYDIVRGALNRTGCVFMETEHPGRLEVIYHVAVDPKGSVPQWVRQMSIKRRGKSIMRLDSYIHEMRLSHLPMQAKLSGPVGPFPKHCATCNVSFRFRASKICQSCSKVICSKCSRKWSLPVLQNAKADVRVCHACSLSVRDGSFWESSRETTSSSSSSIQLKSLERENSSSSIHLRETSSSTSLHLRSLESASMPEVLRNSVRIADDDMYQDYTASLPRPSSRQSSIVKDQCDLSYVDVYRTPGSPKRKPSTTTKPTHRRTSIARNSIVGSSPQLLETITSATPSKLDMDLDSDFNIVAPVLPNFFFMPNKKRFPVPDDFLHPLELSSDQIDKFIKQGDESFKQFVTATIEPMPIQLWSPIGQVHGVSLYQMRSSSNSGIIPYRAVGQISATIEEVAQLHAFETRSKCIDHLRIYASDILDIFPLYSLIDRTEENLCHQVYIKWVAVQSPMSLLNNRDYLFLEAQNQFTLPSGHRGWAYCQNSIELECCPEQKQLDLVRGSFENAGCIFLETNKPGVLDVIYHMAADDKGSIPQFARQLTIRQRSRKIIMVDDHVHQQRLRVVLEGGAANTTTPTSISRPKHCMLCETSFRFRKPRVCKSCSKVICSNCSRSWQIYDGDATPVRICHTCSRTARNGPQPASMGLRKEESISENYLEDDAWSTQPPGLTNDKIDMSYLQVYNTKPRQALPRTMSLNLPAKQQDYSARRARHMSEDDCFADYSSDAALFDVDSLVHPTLRIKLSDERKSILVVLPGASGGFSAGMKELILEKLSEVTIHNDIEAKIRWNVGKANAPANLKLVNDFCPSEEQLKEYGVDGYYVMAHSFGNRVLCEMLGSNSLKNVKGIILSGYPLYGPKDNEERVNQLKLIPKTIKVLAISGTNDEFLNRSYKKVDGEELLKSVFDDLDIEQIQIEMLENCGHDIPKTKGKKQKETTSAAANRVLELLTSFCVLRSR
ncbi:hypothetical protein THRCLA_02474 [Thraustotheca clavata]|uniref:FYVE-type domain-containing protein n=1 Tax=Thraustotheca clavata TaxID=74557 RepID=A0A1W0A525_9STRA|nr:hypothetical protein THRCLA_02474 [Thraustotheca clavata]